METEPSPKAGARPVLASVHAAGIGKRLAKLLREPAPLTATEKGPAVRRRNRRRQRSGARRAWPRRRSPRTAGVPA